MVNVSDINRYILQKTASGAMDKTIGVDMLKMLSSKEQKENIAIIGIECMYSNADNKEEYWKNLINGLETIRDLPTQRKEELHKTIGLGSDFEYARVGYLNRIDQFDAEFFNISPREAKFMDPKQRLFLQVCYHAFEDAGYAGDELYGSKTGIFIGGDHSNDIQCSYKSMIAEHDMLAEIGSTSGVLAGRPAYTLNLRGPAFVIDSACSSAIVSLHLACQALRNGDCDMAAVGGVNMLIVSSKDGKYNNIESQSSAVCTFDKKANGTNWGEGIAAIILKPLSKAIHDRDNIYAVIKGSGVNNDGASNGIIAPNPIAQEELMLKVWKEAGIDSKDISYIEAHGTGTLLGDSIEIKAITSAFKKSTNKKQFCGIGSVKPNIGHSVGASGLASVIKLVLSMKYGVIPPSINFTEPNQNIKFVDSPVFVVDKLTKWNNNEKPLMAALNSFGFNGTNGHIVLESATSNEKKSDCDALELFTLSTHKKILMEPLLEKYIKFLKEETEVSLSDVCYTRNIGRAHGKYRVAYLVSNLDDLVELLKDTRDKLKNNETIYATKAEDVAESSEQAKNLITTYINSGRKNKDSLEEITNHYMQGAYIDWKSFYRESRRRKISLPVSPFCKNTFWVEKAEESQKPYYMASQTKEDYKDWLYRPVWKYQNLRCTGIEKSKTWVVFCGDTPIENYIISRLERTAKKVIRVQDSNSKKDSLINADYYINVEDRNEYIHLFNDLAQKKISTENILLLWNLTEKERYDVSKAYSYDSVIYLIQQLSLHETKVKSNITIVTNQVFTIEGEATDINLYSSLSISACKVVSKEYDTIVCRNIDVLLNETTDITSLGNEIIHEINTPCKEKVVAYRNDMRFIPDYENIEVIEDANHSESGFRTHGVYLITGGLGDLGLEIAEFLVRNYEAKVILTSRSTIPEKERWREWLRQHDKKEKLYKKIERLVEIESIGGEILVEKADVVDYDRMKLVVDQMYETYGCIHGVLHVAGNQGGAMIQFKLEDKENIVLDPKVKGTMVLDKLFRDKKLDVFVLFSSLVALYGVAGQIDYAAANLFLDCYAQRARIRYDDRKVISVNWDNWENIGMAAREIEAAKNNTILQKFYSVGIKPKEGMKALQYITSMEESEVIVSVKDVKEQEKYLEKVAKIGDIDIECTTNKEQCERPEMSVEYVPPRNKIEEDIEEAWKNVFGFNKIGIYDDFNELGGDSLYALSIVTALKKKHSIDIADIYQYPTIEKLGIKLGKANNSLEQKFDNAIKLMSDYQELFKTDDIESDRLIDYYTSKEKYESIDLNKKRDFNNVLLLGSTGYLGIYLLRELLQKTKCNLYTIVRSFKEDATTRLYKKISRYFGEDFIQQYKHRLHVISGQISEIRFGLSLKKYDELAKSVDCVINAAGKVDHYGRYEDFYKTNVFAVEQMIEFCKIGSKKDLHHMSTKGVAYGKVENLAKVVFTENDFDFGQEMPNYYCETKLRAEKLISEARKEGVRANIYRIGEIICDSSNGQFQENIDKNAVCLIIRAMLHMNYLPEVQFKIWENSFVDVISGFIFELMYAENLINENFHMSNPHMIGFEDWNRVFAALGDEKEVVTYDKFMDYLYQNYEESEIKNYVQDFLIHSNLLDMTDVTNFIFMTDRTNLILERLNCKWEAPTMKQLEKMLQHKSNREFFDLHL